MTMPDPITAEERAELRRLAKGATPGPWSAHVDERDEEVAGVTSLASGVLDNVVVEHGQAWLRDAAYIAAANPATVLRLLDALDAAEERRDRLVLVPQSPEVQASLEALLEHLAGAANRELADLRQRIEAQVYRDHPDFDPEWSTASEQTPLHDVWRCPECGMSMSIYAAHGHSNYHQQFRRL